MNESEKPKKRKRAEEWPYSAGDRPHTVTVYTREEGGIIYARVWDARAAGGKGNWLRRSLGHKDKKKARAYADREAVKLAEGASEVGARVTLAQVFALYLKYRTPKKAASEQQADERRAEMWARVLGNIDPHVIASARWEGFISARSSGAIDPRGNPVAEKDRKPVRARSVQADCIWLWLVFNWAAKWKLENGRYLMRENPVRGYEMPRELNPYRPVASHDRFEVLRAISDSHEMEVRVDGKRIKRRSYLSELLDIVNGTGRRIEAVCELRFGDLRLERSATQPFGAIRWPAAPDKLKRERVAPVSPSVRAALDRIVQERPGIGATPLFPSPSAPSKPMSRHLAHSWLERAEEMAGLEPLKHGKWHPYRRKWATERKHHPDKDVMAAGGWESPEALKKSYQHADAATMLAVVLEPTQLREAR